MGWNITYHPLKENEITECYFAVLTNPILEHLVIQHYALDKRSAQRLRRVYQAAREHTNDSFNKSHGVFLAIIAGLFRQYWYLHDSAFSFMVENNPQFAIYAKPWTALVPYPYQRGDLDRGISENYCSGHYLSPAGLQQLQVDYAGDARIWALVEDAFPHGRLAMFWQAVDYAIEHQMGLLEASGIIEIDPVDLCATLCHTSVSNCEKNSFLFP